MSRRKTKIAIVWTIDAWRDETGGWTENDRREVGLVSVPKPATTRQILRCLRHAGYLTSSSKGRVRVHDATWPDAWIEDKNTEQPLLLLEFNYE